MKSNHFMKIDEQDVKNFLNTHFVTYAAFTKYEKRMEFRYNHYSYQIIWGDVQHYNGDDLTLAIKIWNDIC